MSAKVSKKPRSQEEVHPWLIAPEHVTVYFNRDTVYHLSRRAVITGIGGAVGLAVAGSGLTWLLFPRTLPPTHAAWYDSNYLHKKSITINKVVCQRLGKRAASGCLVDVAGMMSFLNCKL